MGASATDHAAVTPFTSELSPAEATTLFERALKACATDADGRAFTGHMLMEMARMSVDDGLVMQLHPGSDRNHNDPVSQRFGPDCGCDIPLATEYTRNLRPLLNKYGNEPAFRLVLFTLDETTYSRELAPLAGHYPAVRLGPPWWFHDSIEGMLRFRYHVTETAGIYNTAGLQRRYARVPVHPRPPRPRPAGGRAVPRGPRLAAHRRTSRGRGDDRRAGVRPGEEDVPALTGQGLGATA